MGEGGREGAEREGGAEGRSGVRGLRRSGLWHPIHRTKATFRPRGKGQELQRPVKNARAHTHTHTRSTLPNAQFTLRTWSSLMTKMMFFWEPAGTGAGDGPGDGAGGAGRGMMPETLTVLGLL